MRTVLRIALMVSLAVVPAFVLVGCQAAEEPEPAAPPPTEEELLDQLASDYEAAWAEGDAAAIAALFTEDGDVVNDNGHFQGRSAVEENLRQGFETIYQGTSIAIESTSVRFLRPDVALVDGAYEITGAMSPEGEELPAIKGLWMGVDVKMNGKWYISSLRPMTPVEAPEPPEEG